MKRKILFGAVGAVGAAAVVLLLSSPALAQDEGPTPAEVQAVLDNMWVFIAGCLVFLMQAGFAMVEAGLTRAKNIGNIMMKNLADMCIGALAFWAVGYGIAFGSDAKLIGTDAFFLSGFGDGAFDGLYTGYTPFFFQVVFAATAVTIASGAMAERTKIGGYLIFSVFMCAIIYPVVVHSFWGGGILTDISIGDAVFSDFAGSTIVHSAGGWAALMGAFFLGPRLGRYDENGRPRAMPGHNIGYAILGVFILWFGWFGFNPGSELAADNTAVRAGVTTLLAAAAGGVGASIVIWTKTKALDVAMVGNGVLAGLVSITAGTATMTPFGAVITGFIGGIIVVFGVFFFDRIRIDDPVGAISVHGLCGVWGTLAIGFFGRYDDAFLGRENVGIFYGGSPAQLVVQAMGVIIVAVWVLVASGILFAVLKSLGMLRVSAEVEAEGLDIHEHGVPGYGPAAQYGANSSVASGAPVATGVGTKVTTR